MGWLGEDDDDAMAAVIAEEEADRARPGAPDGVLHGKAIQLQLNFLA